MIIFEHLYFSITWLFLYLIKFWRIWCYFLVLRIVLPSIAIKVSCLNYSNSLCKFLLFTVLQTWIKSPFPENLLLQKAYFCPCLTHLPAFPLSRCYRPVPHFGSVVQPSKSRVGSDFRPGLSGLYPVCSRKLLRMEIIQHLWANCSTACLSSWWKSLSRYLTWSSVNLIQPPSSLHSPSLPSLFLY